MYFSTRRFASRFAATVALFSASLLFPNLETHAQVTTATVSGTVEDATGALIPGAAVTIKNTKNNFQRKTTANDRAVFSFPSIDAGDYTLTVTMAGFSNYVQKGIHLNPQDSRTLTGIRLKAGATTETVTVEAPQSTLDTGERSSIITSEDIQRLSTEGRDVSELIKILPGSAIATSSLGNQGASNVGPDVSQTSISGVSGGYSVNGSPLNGVSIRSDGANLDDPASYSGTTQNINMESVAEVKVSTSNFGADTANGPIVVNAVGKSGGAQYHGSLYVYARAYPFNSTDALAAPIGQLKPPDHQIYPGFTLGGPVKIPGTNFNHDNKLVFFGSFEDLAQRNVYAYYNASNALLHALVPTQGMRAGDFSAPQIISYLGAAAVSCPLTTCSVRQGYSEYQNVASVPMTGITGQSLGGINGSTTAGNIGPFLDPGASALISLLPLPNRVNQGDGFNYSVNNLVNNDLKQGRIKFDYKPSEADTFSIVYNVETGKVGQPQAPGYAPSGSSGGVDTRGSLVQEINSQTASFNWTRVLSGSATNEFFGSFAHLQTNSVPGQLADLQAAGIGYPYQAAYPNATKQYPQLGDYGYNGLPLGLFEDYTQLPRGDFDTRFTPNLGDNFTKIAGKHSIKIGINIERASNNQVYPGAPTNGSVTNYYTPPVFQVLNSTTGGTSTYYNTCVNPQGFCAAGDYNNQLASFEEGEIDQYIQDNYDPNLDTYWWNIAAYYSDDWKVRPNVTITYGIRVEHLGEWNDAHGIGAAVWNPATAGNTPNPTINNPDQNTLPGFLWRQIDHSLPSSGVHSRFAFYEPRVGFSWDIQGNGKTTVRGGYGQYRFHDNWNDIAQTMASAYGVRVLTIPNATAEANGSPAPTNGLTLAAVGTAQLSQNAGCVATPGLACTSFLGSIAGLAPGDNEQPLNSSYSFTVSRILPFKSSLEVAYVGNSSKYLLNDGSNQAIEDDNVNAIALGGLFQLPPNGRPNPCPYLYPAPTPDPNLPCSPQQVQDFNQGQIQLYRPYENYNDLQVLAHKLSQNYNSLQVTYNKQRGKLTYQLNYTFSKALGIRGGYGNGIPGSAFNLRDNYGPLAYDRSQIFNASYSYDFGAIYHGNRALQQVVNWWLISGISGLQSGPNLQAAAYNSNFGLQGSVRPSAGAQENIPVSSNTFLGTPDVSLQPLLTCDPRADLHKGHGTDQYINGACFQVPQPSDQPNNAAGTTFTYNYVNGPFQYPYVHGPAYFNSDLTIAKDFHITDRQSIQFRAAAFNFLNHPLNTFVGSFPQESQLNFNRGTYTNPSEYGVQSAFGYAPYYVGHRTLEFTMKYLF